MTLAIVAEFGQTFGADLGLAREMVYKYAAAGATHIKVQMIDPEKIATDTAGSYWHTGPKTKQKQSFLGAGIVPHDGWEKLRRECADAGVGFIATPFDLEAVRALRDLSPDVVKIASGDITFFPLLDAVRELGRQVYLSTGAATLYEISQAMERLGKIETTTFGSYHSTFLWAAAPLACTLEYPAREPNLQRVLDLHTYFGSVGYSDHTSEISTARFAVLAGATVLEKHVTMRAGDPSCPDNMMGFDPTKFAQYVQAARDGQALLGARLEPTDAEMAARTGARRAARWAESHRDAVQVVSHDAFTYLRPCDPEDGGSIAVASEAVRLRPVTTRRVRAGDVVQVTDFHWRK